MMGSRIPDLLSLYISNQNQGRVLVVILRNIMWPRGSRDSFGFRTWSTSDCQWDPPSRSELLWAVDVMCGRPEKILNSAMTTLALVAPHLHVLKPGNMSSECNGRVNLSILF